MILSIEHFWNHTTRTEDKIHTDICLDAFAKLRKATVNFSCMFVCLEGLGGTTDTLFFLCHPATKKTPEKYSCGNITGKVSGWMPPEASFCK